MPYIEQSKRDMLDPSIDQLHQELVNIELDDGDQNSMESNVHYIVTRLIRKIYGSSSDEMTDAIGVLERVKLHHFATICSMQQEQDKFDNGDIEINSNPIYTTEIIIETNKEIK